MASAEATHQGASLIDRHPGLTPPVQSGQRRRTTDPCPRLQGIEVTQILTGNGQGQGPTMNQAQPLMLSVITQHRDVVECGIDVGEGLSGPIEHHEGLRGDGASEGHRIGLPLSLRSLGACTRVSKHCFCLIAHGRVICHASTMAHVTSDGAGRVA